MRGILSKIMSFMVLTKNIKSNIEISVLKLKNVTNYTIYLPQPIPSLL